MSNDQIVWWIWWLEVADVGAECADTIAIRADAANESLKHFWARIHCINFDFRVNSQKLSGEPSIAIAKDQGAEGLCTFSQECISAAREVRPEGE